jgi:hypothetical protein
MYTNVLHVLSKDVLLLINNGNSNIIFFVFLIVGE